MKARSLVAAVLIASVAGCASYRPVMDMKGVNSAQYEADLADCQRVAEQVDVGKHAAIGGAALAVFGAALGAAIGGGRSGYARSGAAIGAVQGVGTGAAQGAGAQRMVVINCLRGRGYNPLY